MKFIEEERAKIGQEGRVRKGEKRGEKEGGRGYAYPCRPPTAALLVKTLSGLVIQKMDGELSDGMTWVLIPYFTCRQKSKGKEKTEETQKTEKRYESEAAEFRISLLGTGYATAPRL